MAEQKEHSARFVSVKEAAERLGVSKDAVYKLISRNEIPVERRVEQIMVEVEVERVYVWFDALLAARRPRGRPRKQRESEGDLCSFTEG